MTKFDFIREPLVLRVSLNEQINADAETDDVVYNNNHFLVEAIKVIRFKAILNNGNECSNVITKSFKPNMAHQIFDENETIFGYKNLRVTVKFLANSFHVMADIRYTEKCDDSLDSNAVPDNILGALSDWFPSITTNSTLFNNRKLDEDFTKMYGELIMTFPYIGTEHAYLNAYVTKWLLRNPPDREYIDFHRRFQSFIVFYIDAASQLEMEDPNWEIFYLYIDVKISDEMIGRVPIGFLTVYRFLDTKRARVSQIFILPNFQLMGFGVRFLGAVYEHYNNDSSILLITVESPALGFTIIRDRLELKLIYNESVFSRERVLSGLASEMKTLCARKYKISERQASRLYLILFHFYSNGRDKVQFKEHFRKLTQHRYNKMVCKGSRTGKPKSKSIRTLRHILTNKEAFNSSFQAAYNKHVSQVKHQMNFLAGLLNHTHD